MISEVGFMLGSLNILLLLLLLVSVCVTGGGGVDWVSSHPPMNLKWRRRKPN